MSPPPTGVVQGMITGIRGLCNGLGPALYGFIFFLFNVELDTMDPIQSDYNIDPLPLHSPTEVGLFSPTSTRSAKLWCCWFFYLFLLIISFLSFLASSHPWPAFPSGCVHCGHRLPRRSLYSGETLLLFLYLPALPQRQTPPRQQGVYVLAGWHPHQHTPPWQWWGEPSCCQWRGLWASAAGQHCLMDHRGRD